MRRAMPILVWLIACASVSGQHWPSLRGPNASGVSDGHPTPVKWNAPSGESVLWKTPIPGVAVSSPVVWGDRVFVSTAVSSDPHATIRTGLYGDVEPSSDLSRHSWRLVALDKRTGKVLWERVAHEGVPRTKRHPKSSQASPTPVTDGRHVVVSFGSEGLYTYDVDGKLLWKRDLGVLNAGWFYDPDYEWGVGSSPIIGANLIIVTNGYRGVQPIYAIKPGAKGDITLKGEQTQSEFIAWSTKRGGPYIPTPLIYRDQLYVCSNNGVLSAYGVRTGQRLYQERLGGTGGSFSASPVAADGKIYLASEDGDVFVVKSWPTYELLATNSMGEGLMATPAISEGLIIIRGLQDVFAIGQPTTTKPSVH